jgi:hypothetical protein
MRRCERAGRARDTHGERIMSLRIEERSPSTLTLVDETGEVGWLRPRAIGFCGFSSEQDALRAAALARTVVADWLAERGRTPQRARKAPPSHLARAAGNRLLVNGAECGWFLRPAQPPAVGRDSFGFEIALPPEVANEPAIQLAHRAHEALALLRSAGQAGDLVGLGR